MNAKVIDDHSPETANKEIAILQITRIGDILQTCHAVRLLKINHPEYNVTLIARKQFAEPVKFLIDQIFDDVKIIDFKRSINLADGFSGSLKNIKNILKDINTKKFSASINLSFSKSSSYLHSMINSDHKIGPYYNEANHKVIHDKWSQYLFSSVMRGDLNPFNLVDLFSNIIGVKKDNTHLTNSNFSKEKKENILLHPFASLEKKYWKSNKWSEVILRVLEANKDITIHIAGSSSDKDGYEKIVNVPILEKYRSRIKPLLGKSLSELYAQVDDTYLFVGHDSMIGNLLSFKNIKTITISLGTVRPMETAPYSINNYILSSKTKCYPCFPDTPCEFYKCHGDIPYQVLQEVISQLLISNKVEKEQFLKRVSPFHMNSVNISKTTVNKVGHLTLSDVLDEYQTERDVFRDFYRTIWSYAFSEVDVISPLPNISEATASSLGKQAQTVVHLFELAEFGKKYSRYILEEISKKAPEINKIKDYSKKIDEVDRLLDVLVEANELIAPIVDYGVVAKSNLSGNNLVSLTESSFYVYQEMSNAASIIHEFLTKLNLTNTNQQTPRKSL